MEQCYTRPLKRLLKNIVMPILVLSLAGLLVRFCTPRDLGALIPFEESSRISLLYSQVVAVVGVNNSFGSVPAGEHVYASFERGTTEFQEIVNILNGYHYYRLLSSPFSTDLNTDGNSDLFIWFYFPCGNVTRLFLRNASRRNMMTGNRVYRIGCRGTKEISLLLSQILEAML